MSYRQLLLAGTALAALVPGYAGAQDVAGERNALTGPPAQQGSRIEHGQGRLLIDAHGMCRWVSNYHGSALYIPLNTGTEWITFVSNAPGTVWRETCCMPTTFALCGSSFSVGYGHAGMSPVGISAGSSRTATVQCDGSGWTMVETGGECEPPPPPPAYGGGGGSQNDNGPPGSTDMDGDGKTDTEGFNGGGYGWSSDSVGAQTSNTDFGGGTTNSGGDNGSSGGCWIYSTLSRLGHISPRHLAVICRWHTDRMDPQDYAGYVRWSHPLSRHFATNRPLALTFAALSVRYAGVKAWRLGLVKTRPGLAPFAIEAVWDAINRAAGRLAARSGATVHDGRTA